MLTNPHYIEQNPIVPSEFITTRVQCTNDFSSGDMPDTGCLDGYGLAQVSWKICLNHYNEKHLSFQYLLDRKRSVSTSTSILQILATELFKNSKDVTPNVFDNILIAIFLENYSLCYQAGFRWPWIRSVFMEWEHSLFCQ